MSLNRKLTECRKQEVELINLYSDSDSDIIYISKVLTKNNKRK